MGPGGVDRVLSLPAERAVDELARLPEDQWFERKSGRISSKDLAVPLVAMANAEGGYVVVGISEGTVEGVRDERLNAMVRSFPGRFRTDRALSMGFQADRDIGGIIQDYMASERITPK